MSFAIPILELSEGRIDEIATNLYNEVISRYTSGGVVPTNLELMRTAKNDWGAGLVGAKKCVEWIEEVYRKELEECNYHFFTR